MKVRKKSPEVILRCSRSSPLAVPVQLSVAAVKSQGLSDHNDLKDSQHVLLVQRVSLCIDNV